MQCKILYLCDILHIYIYLNMSLHTCHKIILYDFMPFQNAIFEGVPMWFLCFMLCMGLRAARRVSKTLEFGGNVLWRLVRLQTIFNHCSLYACFVENQCSRCSNFQSHQFHIDLLDHELETHKVTLDHW